MTVITLQGVQTHVYGTLPKVGDKAPDFILVNGKLEDHSLANYKGKKKVLNIVPSLDTAVCSTSAKRFNAAAKNKTDSVFLTISADLPFAASRFCSTENTGNIVPLSMMRSNDFAKSYGVLIEDGPLAGITARAIVVLDTQDIVLYTELVPEIAQEPDYDAALMALS